MKALSASLALVSCAPQPTIVLPLGSTINIKDYEIFDDSEELLESENVTLQQPLSLYPIILLPQNNHLLLTASCTK